MLRLAFLLLALAPAWLAAGEPGRVAFAHALPDGLPPFITDVRFQRGDDPRWAAKDFDDRGWQGVALNDLPSRDGIYWLRFRVADSAKARDSVGLSIVASYELYWDGRLIGRNGVVGASRETETPGPLDNLFRLPDEVNGPGEHVVALRLSSFSTGFPAKTYGVVFRVVSLREYLGFKARTTAWMMVGTGAVLIAGIVFGLMWLLVGRQPAVGWFALACLGAACERGLQAWRWLDSYPYDWHYPRLLLITGIVAALGIVRVLFLRSFFRLPAGGWWIALLVASMGAVWPLSAFYNAKALAFGSCSLGVSLGMTLHAWRLKRRGAGWILAGLVVSAWGLSEGPADFLEHSFIYNSGAVMLGCVAALTFQLRDERRAAHAAQLAAVRLETELLKKNLQPHFLLNTLATIQEVIEQEPRTAIAMIDALAAEFRILARVSGEKLITLGQELELCAAHLSVMSGRKAARCSLVTQGVEDEALVPPALFHTLIENGLTHLLPRDGRIEFEIAAERRGDTTRYTLTARGERQRRETAGDAAAREGTGLRYIKARLEESFTGRWSIESRACEEGWRTVIDLRGAAAAAGAAKEATPGASTVPEVKPA